MSDFDQSGEPSAEAAQMAGDEGDFDLEKHRAEDKEARQMLQREQESFELARRLQAGEPIGEGAQTAGDDQDDASLKLAEELAARYKEEEIEEERKKKKREQEDILFAKRMQEEVKTQAQCNTPLQPVFQKPFRNPDAPRKPDCPHIANTTRIAALCTGTFEEAKRRS